MGSETRMEPIYTDTAKMLKAISDPKRLRIIDMLSCGELCATQILEAFQITQPTLSHDMKVLTDANLVSTRREGKNTYYSLSREALDGLHETLGNIFHDSEDCICHRLLDEPAGEETSGCGCGCGCAP